MRLKSVFISDVHLGSRHSHASELLEFLSLVKNCAPEKFYIVGDFIDGWKLKRNWYWDDNASLIVRKILSLIRRETEIFWVAGNHDEFIREFIDDFRLFNFGHIHLGNEFIHETNDKKFLVVHGDMFDLVTSYAKWLCWLGDIGYDILLYMNRFINGFRRIFKMPHWSLSKAIKYNVKKAVNYVSDFERVMIRYARDRDCAGCICGHIHTAANTTLEDGFIYLNSGDWMESCTAILEDMDGNFKLYHHHEDSDRQLLSTA
jgi:UDP-2,3-diacylglucosamine pyrophosphatase LpxH